MIIKRKLHISAALLGGILSTLFMLPQAQLAMARTTYRATLAPQYSCTVPAGSYTVTAAAAGILQGSYTCPNSTGAVNYTVPLPPVPVSYSITVPTGGSTNGQVVVTPKQTTTLSQFCAGQSGDCTQLCKAVNCQTTMITYWMQGSLACSSNSSTTAAAEGTEYTSVALQVFNPKNPSQTCSGTATSAAATAGTLKVPSGVTYSSAPQPTNPSQPVEPTSTTTTVAPQKHCFLFFCTTDSSSTTTGSTPAKTCFLFFCF